MSSRGSPWRLGTPIACAPGSPRVGIQWARRRMSSTSQSLLKLVSIESALRIRWPKYWSFSFSISPSNECSGLISFRIHWFDLLAARRILKSLLQHHSLKASVLWHSTFFLVHFSHLYMTTGKTITLTIWTFVGKIMSLLFNMLSRLVITFLPGSKRLLISWFGHHLQ